MYISIKSSGKCREFNVAIDSFDFGPIPEDGVIIEASNADRSDEIVEIELSGTELRRVYRSLGGEFGAL